MDFNERIKLLRERRKMTLEQVGDIVGVGKSTVRKWETGDIHNMGRDKIEKLAKALGVTPAALMGWNDHTIVLDRSDAISITTKRIPILGDTAAGQPIIANREYDEYIDVPMDGRRFDAAVRVTGDSMEPGYKKGDLALVQYMNDVKDGQIAVVCLDDEVTLKRVYHTDQGLVLISDNPKYAPMNVTYDEVTNIHLTGRAIGCIHWEY